ncbi:hypothetical protein [Corynebacterium amycolatum]|uniref:hypothetical protein n=1 Tax=Corynebacterium amycolatum TaxID=43765 RepID=UPI001CCBF459|nr:hypothetical protein [Corynebacterium amycolatum]MCA0444287.1 hypothetical protein [Corynebacterium amycolatum]
MARDVPVHLPIVKGKVECPVCGRLVDHIKVMGKIRAHFKKGTQTSLCRGADYVYVIGKPTKAQQAVLDQAKARKARAEETKRQQLLAEVVNDETPSWLLTQGQIDKREAEKKKLARKAREEKEKAERRRQRELDEMAIWGEDSWGKDNLGWEGGEKSVRARRGGRVEGNRTRY